MIPKLQELLIVFRAAENIIKLLKTANAFDKSLKLLKGISVNGDDFVLSYYIYCWRTGIR